MILTETKCIECKKPFLPTNKRNTYCSDGCKQEAYRERKGITRPNFLPDSNGDKFQMFKSEKRVLVYSKIYTRAFTDQRKVIDNLKGELSSIKKEVKANEKRIYNIENRNNDFFLKRAAAIWSGFMILLSGWVIGLLIKSFFKTVFGRLPLALLAMPFILLAWAIGYKSQKNSDNKHIEDLVNLSSFKNVLKDAQNRAEAKELEVIKEEMTLSAIPEFQLLTEEETKQIEENIKLPKYGLPEIKTNDAKETMSLRDLQNKQFKTLEFTGEWRELIGKPEQNFSMMVYGQSGHGKSYFVGQLSEYLANNFGDVLYNSSEEGISLSLQDKVKKLDSDKLRISNFKDFESIKKHLKQSISKFVVLDSVNHMNLKSEQLEELKKINLTRSFITIHQVTKNGEFKGNNEFLHNCDVQIVVTNRVPLIEKNRYKIG